MFTLHTQTHTHTNVCARARVYMKMFSKRFYENVLSACLGTEAETHTCRVCVHTHIHTFSAYSLNPSRVPNNVCTYISTNTPSLSVSLPQTSARNLPTNGDRAEPSLLPGVFFFFFFTTFHLSTLKNLTQGKVRFQRFQVLGFTCLLYKTIYMYIYIVHTHTHSFIY